MSINFTPVNYTDNVTVIRAKNLNDIQAAITSLDGVTKYAVTAYYHENAFYETKSYTIVDGHLVEVYDGLITPAEGKVYVDKSTSLAYTWNGANYSKLGTDEIYDSTTVSGSIVTFDAPGELPLKDLVVNIEPVQSGSGDPSPTNVRPISGWTGCNVAQTGQNLLDTSKSTVGQYIAEDGTIVSNDSFAISELIPVVAGICQVSYTSTEDRFRNIRLHGFDSSGQWLRQLAVFTQNSAGSYEFDTTIANDIAFIRLSYPKTITNGLVNNGPLYPIAFPSEAGTVYGGTYNPVTGELIITPGTYVLDSVLPNQITKSTSADIKAGRAGYFFSYANNTWLQDIALSGGGTNPNNISCLCDIYNIGNTPSVDVVPAETFAIGIGQASGGGGRYATTFWFNVSDTDCPDIESFCSYINNLAPRIVFPLKSPIVYYLNQFTLDTVNGQNSIWSDCGDVTVTYGAYLEALKDSIDRSNTELETLRACIAPIENGSTAAHAYSAGDYFFRNGAFCVALAGIAIGGAFTLGTNYQVTTIADVLIALQS